MTSYFCFNAFADVRDKPTGALEVGIMRLLWQMFLQVQWRRVVLDEAHSIKDRRCSTAKAVFALDSKYKWALSGTPLQVLNPSLMHPD